MIKVTNLNKYYNKGKSNEIHVINNTSIILPNEGLIAFLGQSGSGKTTLINAIAGLDKAKGEIAYDDEVFKNYSARKIDKFRVENVGYVFQNYNLINDMSVYDNLRLQLALIGIKDKKQVDERIDYVLDQLKIKKYKNKNAGNLSGGQMQRVSIARALVKDSKIIICDEPTGNLDSENTIEVMNILKAISKTKLVLLVTHDKKNASFYADRIVEIKDGEVVSDLENTSVESLDMKSSNNIYLKDLENKEYQNDNINIKLYTDDGSSLSDLNITIVKANGNLYLKCDGVGYLDDSSKIKLIDDNYRDMTKDDTEKLEFNPTPFEYKKSFSFKPVFKALKNAWNNFINASKKLKWLNFCSVIIGLIMAISVLIISTTRTTDKSKIDSYTDCYMLGNRYEDLIEFNKIYDKLVDDGVIDDLVCQTTFQMTFSPTINGFTSSSIGLINSNHINSKFVAGKLTTNYKDCVLTTKVADQVINKMNGFMNLSYEKLIGQTITLGGVTDYVISGICSSNDNNVFVNSSSIEVYCLNNNKYGISSPSYIIDHKKFADYNILAGKDISSKNEIIVNKDYYIDDSSYYAIGNTIETGGITKTIVGIFDLEYYITSDGYNPMYLSIDDDYIKTMNGYTSYYSNTISYKEDVTLVSGRMPASDNEILVPNYYNMDSETLSSLSNAGLKIVGYYESSAKEGAFIYTKEAALKDNHSCLVTTTDAKILKDSFNEYNFKVDTYFNYLYNQEVEEQKQIFATLASIVAAFIAVIFVYTYFITRSKMIHRIYEIGVLREIGTKKSKIYGSFLSEIFISTTFTSVIGYIALLCLFQYAIKKMNFQIITLYISPLYTMAGLGLLYSSSIISGLLPVFLLLRKTPAEIVAKYDL